MKGTTMDAPNEAGAIGEELRQDARSLGDSAKARALGEVDQRKGTAATQAKSVSEALDRAAGDMEGGPEWLRSAFRKGSQTLGRLAESVEHKDARELTRNVEQMARDNPATFLGVCAMAGFVAARVVKAGAGDAEQGGTGSMTEAEGWSEPYAPPQSAGSMGLGAEAAPYATQHAGSAVPYSGGQV